MDKHRIQIKIPDAYPLNTEILLDGQPLLGVTRLKVEASSDGSELAKVTLEMFMDIEVDIEGMTVREYTVDRNTGEYVNPDKA